MNPVAVGLVMMTALTGAVHDDAANELAKRGYRTVGVCPRVLSATEVSAEQQTLGPLSDRWAADLRQALSEAGKTNGFQVKDAAAMKSAFRGHSLKDLQDLQFLKRLNQQLGLEALVVIKTEDKNSRRFQHVVEVLDLRAGESVAQLKESSAKTISEAAYGGESWELRRWVKRADGSFRLDPIGLNLEGEAGFGLGPVYEQMQYVNLRQNRPHPLLDSTCPLGFRVVVNGQERPLEKIGGHLYVALEPQEEYVVQCWNLSEREAYAALQVDGMNSINHRLARPAELEDHEVWHLQPGLKNATIRGWLTHNAQNQQHEWEAFRVVSDAAESVAGEAGFLDRIGTITATFHTKGMTDVPEAKELVSRSAPTTFGVATGRGSRQNRTGGFDENAQSRGVMLAAMTVHYRTAAELSALKASLKPKPVEIAGPAQPKPPVIAAKPRPEKPAKLRPPTLDEGPTPVANQPPQQPKQETIPSETEAFPEEKPQSKPKASETEAFPED